MDNKNDTEEQRPDNIELAILDLTVENSSFEFLFGIYANVGLTFFKFSPSPLRSS